jgi:DNA-binding MarR family transcriptional regulator
MVGRLVGAYGLKMAEDSDLAESLRVSFARLNRALKIEGVRDRNHPYARLNVPDLVALDLIGRKDTCIMSDVAQELESPMSTVTSVVDRLVKGGLVSRERDAKDKRSIRLVPTKQGRKLLATLSEEQRRSCQIVLAALKPKERDIFVSLIAKVASAIEADAFKAK